MGRRKVILHVGQSKAGSTSIQNYLEKQRLQLSKRGFLFPHSGFSRKNPFDATRTSGHLGLLRDLQKGQLIDFEKEISFDQNSTLILSVENLFSEQPDHVFDRLAEYFKDWDVHIVAVLRDQMAWLRSRYVENTMSGFSCRSEHFANFVTATFQRRVLSYRERVEFLKQRLNAQSSSTINFDSTSQALVPRFLDVIGVPITDPDGASEVHDNRREKPLFLVEAKRRLNILTNGLRLEARLELEHALRERGKAMLLDGAPANTINELEVFLTQNERRTLEQDNLLLSKDGAIDQPIELEASSCRLSRETKSRISAAADDLFWFGLEFARKLVDPAAKDLTTPLASLNLYFEASKTWRETLSKEPVSVHIGVSETAILAACKERRIVRLVLEESPEAYKIAAFLDALPLPSPVVTLVVQDLKKQTMQSLMQKYSFPAPGLMIKEGTKMQVLENSEIEQELALDSLMHVRAKRSPLALYRSRTR